MEYESLFKAARKAGTALADVEPERLGRILQHAARLLRGHTPALLEANARDIEAMPASSPMLDRLRLTPERIGSIASDMEAVSHLRSPQGEELARWTRPNGMTIVKRRVPFGVVGMVCEARPNVTADIFALCVKTGNACVLKGGSDARHSNEAIAALLHEALGAEGIDENTFTLLPAGHEAVGALLSAVGYVDVVIPRGGAGLIRFVRENARIPVIETGAGIVHTYFDIDGERIRHAVGSYMPDNNRSQRTETERNTLIVDCYNANPSSMRASVLNFLAEPAGGRSRRVLILGDMLELGAWSEQEHRDIVALAGRNPDTELMLVGGEFARACAGMEPQPANTALFPSREELIAELRRRPVENAFVLVKGSRGIGLEKALEEL